MFSDCMIICYLKEAIKGASAVSLKRELKDALDVECESDEDGHHVNLPLPFDLANSSLPFLPLPLDFAISFLSLRQLVVR